MASNLFHDAARAYYGVSYTLGDARTTGTGTRLPDPDDAIDDTSEKSPAGGKYVKPELPPIAQQPKSSPGQKMLFSGNAGQRDNSPVIEQKPWEGPDVTGKEVPPFQARKEGMTAVQDYHRRKHNMATGHAETDQTVGTDLPVKKPDFSMTGTGTRVKVPEGKYAAVPPPPPPPPSKSLSATEPAAAGSPPAMPVVPKPRISEKMKMATQRIQQRHNAEQRVPPSNKPWT